MGKTLKYLKKNVGSLWLPIIFCGLTSQIQAQSSLKLPFFDDFSTAKNGVGVSTFWMPGGGVYINNTMATTQPSINIATFDGRDGRGIPYNFNNKLATGATDTLTSKPIQLNYTVADSVVLSFLWLAKGLGERPDSEDTLQVEFLDKNLNWVIVDYLKIEDKQKISPNFSNRFITVKKQDFFWDKFQFRFVAHGRQSGPFDNWHLDYIYLDKGRKVKQIYSGNDLAVRTNLSRLFKDYVAMPIGQFLVNPAKEMADSMKVDVVNLASTARNVSGNVKFSILNDTTNAVIKEYSYLPTNLFDVQESRKEGVKLVPLAVASKNIKLRYRFEFKANDDTLSGVNYAANNSVEATTELSDYFAYDDGSAEFAAEVDKRFGKVAIQFDLRKADFVKAVRMNFMPFFKELKDESFLIQILDSKNGKPADVLAQQAFTANYPAMINGFVEYKLKQAVPVNGVFYVAWTRIGENNIPVGIDKNNTDFSSKIYYSLGTEWVKNTDLIGSFMVRAVMGQGSATDTKVLAAEEIQPEVILMPNPTAGIVSWTGEQIQKAEIFAMTGQLMQTKNFEKDEIQELDLSNMVAGQYIVRLYGSIIITKRIILMK